MSNRRKEREYAFKIIFANYFNQESVDEISEKLIDSDSDASRYISEFSSQLAKFTIDESDKTDAVIESKLKDWSLDRINMSDRILLRMALSEFAGFKDIPAEVTINEILELAKQYGTDKSTSFINGILDAVYRDLKKSQ